MLTLWQLSTMVICMLPKLDGTIIEKLPNLTCFSQVDYDSKDYENFLRMAHGSDFYESNNIN